VTFFSFLNLDRNLHLNLSPEQIMNRRKSNIKNKNKIKTEG